MFQLLAVCPMGLEVIAKEIQELGYETQVENGRIFLKVMLKLLCNVIYGYAYGDRIKIVVGRFNASTFDELLKTKSLPWENIIDKEGQFPVQGRSVKSTLYSVPDCQAITKKQLLNV